MKNHRTFLIASVVVAVLICLCIIIVKSVSGAIALFNGVFNTILGIIIIIALLLLVLWMFHYANKNKK